MSETPNNDRPLVVQTRLASGPTLDAIESAVRLLLRAEGSHSLHERESAYREHDKLADTWRLCSARLDAHAPPGARVGGDDGLVTAAGIPWWRTLVATTSVTFAGFSGHRPWSSERDDYVMRIFGTRSAVAQALGLYAEASVAIGVASSGEPQATRDEYALGMAVAMSGEYGEIDKQRKAAAHGEDMTKIIVWSPAENAEKELEAHAGDEASPLRRGNKRALGLAKRAAGARLRLLGSVFGAPVWLVDAARAEALSPGGVMMGSWSWKDAWWNTPAVLAGEIWVADTLSPPEVVESIVYHAAELQARRTGGYGPVAIAMAQESSLRAIQAMEQRTDQAPRTREHAVIWAEHFVRTVSFSFVAGGVRYRVGAR